MVYSSCMAGQLETAKQLAANVPVGTAVEQRFWTWMASTFQVGPYSGS